MPYERDPEVELNRINRRFRAVTRGYERRMFLRRLYRRTRILILIVISIAAIWWYFSQSPWPVTTTIRHLAAFPNCNAARAIGSAPSNTGEPGYWSRHDRDGDGVACEPWSNP